MKQNILVTGASSGIGFACAEQLAQSNSYELIVITGRDKQKLEEACNQLKSYSESQIIGLELDQSNREATYSFIDRIVSLELNFDAVISNIGMNTVHEHGPKKCHRTPIALFEDSFSCNLVNQILILQNIIPKLITNSRSKIILIGSRAYQEGIKGQSPYNTSKAALVGLYTSLNSEYCDRNFFCDLINPGIVANHRTAALRKKNPGINEKALDETELAKLVLQRLNIDRGEEINV